MGLLNTPRLKFSAVVFGDKAFHLRSAPSPENPGREFDKTTMLRIVVALMLVLGVSLNVGAKIVAFTDGRILKVDDAYL